MWYNVGWIMVTIVIMRVMYIILWYDTNDAHRQEIYQGAHVQEKTPYWQQNKNRRRNRS